MPTITREQLESIEWNGWNRDEANTCPVCKGEQPDPESSFPSTGHAPDCWLAAALATPDTLPPVEVGDWVADIEDPKPYLVKYEREAAELNTPRLARYISEVRGHRDGVAYRWQRGKA
jgi:hypothetical protein